MPRTSASQNSRWTRSRDSTPPCAVVATGPGPSSGPDPGATTGPGPSSGPDPGATTVPARASVTDPGPVACPTPTAGPEPGEAPRPAPEPVASVDPLPDAVSPTNSSTGTTTFRRGRTPPEVDAGPSRAARMT